MTYLNELSLSSSAPFTYDRVTSANILCPTNVDVYLWHTHCSVQDPILQHGWKTGAIIPELEKEVATANSAKFKRKLADVLALEKLLLRKQVCLCVSYDRYVTVM